MASHLSLVEECCHAARELAALKLALRNIVDRWQRAGEPVTPESAAYLLSLAVESGERH